MDTEGDGCIIIDLFITIEKTIFKAMQKKGYKYPPKENIFCNVPQPQLMTIRCEKLKKMNFL